MDINPRFNFTVHLKQIKNGLRFFTMNQNIVKIGVLDQTMGSRVWYQDFIEMWCSPPIL